MSQSHHGRHGAHSIRRYNIIPSKQTNRCYQCLENQMILSLVGHNPPTDHSSWAFLPSWTSAVTGVWSSYPSWSVMPCDFWLDEELSTVLTTTAEWGISFYFVKIKWRAFDNFKSRSFVIHYYWTSMWCKKKWWRDDDGVIMVMALAAFPQLPKQEGASMAAFLKNLKCDYIRNAYSLILIL